MRSSERSPALPVPDGWRDVPRARPAALVVVLLVAVGFGGLAVWAWRLGYPLVAVVPGFVAMVVGYAGTRAVVDAVRGGVPVRGIGLGTRQGRAVTRVRHVVSAFAVVLVFKVAGAAGLLWLAYDATIDGQIAYAIVTGTAGGLLLGGIGAVVTGRSRVGALSLDPDGFHMRGWTYEADLRWADVERLDACVLTAGRGVRSRVIEVVPRRGTRRRHQVRTIWLATEIGAYAEGIELDCERFVLDRVMLFDLVRFDVEHPGHRHELGTAASIERVRRGDLLGGRLAEDAR